VSSAQPLLNGSHNPTAVFIAWGAKVKPGKQAEIHIFDVAPTLYALLGLPAAVDMPGKALEGMFELKPLEPAGSYVREKGGVAVGGNGLADQQLREQLEALGYMSEEDRQVIGASRRQE
jgi:arylsulfatase A-like enzyme